MTKKKETSVIKDDLSMQIVVNGVKKLIPPSVIFRAICMFRDFIDSYTSVSTMEWDGYEIKVDSSEITFSGMGDEFKILDRTQIESFYKKWFFPFKLPLTVEQPGYIIRELMVPYKGKTSGLLLPGGQEYRPIPEYVDYPFQAVIVGTDDSNLDKLGKILFLDDHYALSLMKNEKPQNGYRRTIMYKGEFFWLVKPHEVFVTTDHDWEDLMLSGQITPEWFKDPEPKERNLGAELKIQN